MVSFIKKNLNKTEEFVAVMLYGFILFMLSYQIILRYVFSSSNMWSEEISRYAFVWIVYLASSYAVKENRHLRIDILMIIWPKKIRPYIPLVGNLIWLVFCLIITYLSAIYVVDMYGMNQLSMGLKINLGLVYAILPIGNFLISIRLVISIIETFKKTRAEINNPSLVDTQIDTQIDTQLVSDIE